ncbi:MAG: RIP metalloprotease RseP [Alphaproteobacteria bacterium]|nr:RIP metalloprotease RseP [Alphaproteobacteria bacterium]
MIESFLNSGLYLFAFVLVLSIVVMVHEWGHFVIARLCGVKVTHFSLGFGRVLWKRTDKKGTQWQVCLWPLGGYVKMLGDEDAASAKTDTAKIPAKEQKYMFASQPLHKRAAIIFAGPAMNYIFAILLFTGIFFIIGRSTVPPVIHEFLEVSPAREIGLMQGDRIVNINDHEINEWSDILRVMRIAEFGKDLKIIADRNGQQLTFHVTPIYHEEYKDKLPRIGIKMNYEALEHQKMDFLEAITTSTKLVYTITSDTLKYLGQILLGKRDADGMRGPLGIAEMSGDAFKGGLEVLILFIANISVAIGFMNLLPIPLLDGGHLFFYAIEAIIRRPLSERIQNALLWIGVSLLVTLLMYTMFLDIPRIFERIFG